MKRFVRGVVFVCGSSKRGVFVLERFVCVCVCVI